MFSLEEYIKEIQNNLDNNQQRDLKWLVKDLPNNPNNQQISTFKTHVKQLQQGKPLAYILGNIPFYNCKITLNDSTLIPRPETELLVDIIIQRWKDKLNKSTHILDLCSGSGCIAIALQKTLKCIVDAVDLNLDCCTIIKKNAQLNNTNINIFQSNMFQNINGKYDLIISNPPYIPTAEIQKLDKNVKDYEPHTALDGGKDGLDFYRTIAEQSIKHLNKNGKLALEIGYNQGKSITQLLQTNFIDIEIKNDYSNLPRFIFATLK